MNEKDILKELNNITYNEDELKNYIETNNVTDFDELHMRKHYIKKAITEKEAYIFISEKLRDSEQVLHIMGLENMHARYTQMSFSAVSGVGALPFLNMSINAILFITTERLFVSLVDGDFQTGTLREYELKDVEYLKTAFDMGSEYLYIKIKGKKVNDFMLYCPEYDYEKLFKKLSVPFSSIGVQLIYHDKKSSKKNLYSYITFWVLFAAFFASIISKFF